MAMSLGDMLMRFQVPAGDANTKLGTRPAYIESWLTMSHQIIEYSSQQNMRM